MARGSYMIPGSKEAMNKFKLECAAEIGHLQYAKENNDHYKGDVSSRQEVSGGRGFDNLDVVKPPSP